MGGNADSSPTLEVSSSTDSVTALGSQFLVNAAPDRLQAGDLLDGRYQLEAVVGLGASGRVLRAFDRETRTVVAVKVLKPDLASDPLWLDRLSRELRVGRQIQHPNVCRVFEVGEADGYRFLTMEIAPGGPISGDVRQKKGTFDWPRRVVEFRGVLEGVTALHEGGIIHRDLKPENILRMADGRLVVSDFGLATDPGVGPTSTIMVGTPSYMAPEVVMGELGTAQSDVWALGIVMHEFLFGCRPTWKTVGKGTRRLTVATGANRQEQAIADLCSRCLNDLPEGRPSSAGALLLEFNVAASGDITRPRARRGSLVWGALALAALSTLLLTRSRLWTRATASSDASVRAMDAGVLTPRGIAQNWQEGSRRIAQFAGRIRCQSLLRDGNTLRVIWGSPPRADDVDIRSGRIQPAPLVPEALSDGCPQLSPDGRQLLFVRSDHTGSHIELAASPDGSRARDVVRGTWPHWLPNGQEFAFHLDARHAAIFSLPTAEMTVVGEDVRGARQLAELAVDDAGQNLALRYFDETANSRIVVQSLKSMEAESSFVVPPSAMKMAFLGPANSLTFTLDGKAGGAELVAADWRNGSLTKVAAFPGSDIIGAVESGDETLVLTRKIRGDLWQDGAEGITRLTSDGNSFAGALSSKGDLLIQRFAPDGRYVIAIRRLDGEEKTLTSGPLDGSPSFFPDRDSWAYTDYKTQQILKCALSTARCSVVHTDSRTPAEVSVAPSGDRLAYFSTLNAVRLYVLKLDGGPARDLGPASNACPAVWMANDRLWALDMADSQPLWAEFDVVAGSRTGRTLAGVPGSKERCRLPAPLRATGLGETLRVFAVLDEHSELHAREGR